MSARTEAVDVSRECLLAAEPTMRVVVIATQRAVAEALAEQLGAESDMVAEALTPDDELAGRDRVVDDVDVVVAAFDDHPDELVNQIRGWRDRRLTAIVATSVSDDPRRIADAVAAGATAWVPQRASLSHLLETVRRAAHGEAAFPPRTLRLVLEHLTMTPTRSGAGHERSLATLTFRERQILDFIVAGLDRRDIARQLGVSVNTVRTHVQHLLTKLGVHTTLEAVALVLRDRARPRKGGVAG